MGIMGGIDSAPEDRSTKAAHAALVDDAELLDTAFIRRSECDSVAVVDSDRELSWRQLNLRVRAVVPAVARTFRPLSSWLQPSSSACLTIRGYGSTELPTATACNADDPVAKRAHIDGRPIDAAEVRVVDSGGFLLAAGHEGEVQLRGPELFVGYLDADCNIAARTADKWFVTGDLGLIDHDGYLSITGRVKDVIIRGGENLSAREIESLMI